jgi:hypothetical protein
MRPVDEAKAHGVQSGPMGSRGDRSPGVGPQGAPWRDRVRERRGECDWSSLKDRIDLRTVAAGLLGEPRRIDGSGRHWWVCPFHPDRNPSFCVTPDRGSWKCFGCGARGDAAALVMKRNGVGFAEAVRYLGEGLGLDAGRPWRGDRGPRPAHRPGARASEAETGPALRRSPPPSPPRGLPTSDALALVASARERLWSPQGLRYRRWLHLRGLTNDTIRAAGLGWTPGVRIPARGDIRYFRASGIVIPWLDGDRLVMAKVRQPASRKPKYREAFRDAPRIYPSPESVRLGMPLVLVEGEFDALLLGQELAGLASVATVGSASATIEASAWDLCRASAIFAAHDADPAGDRAAASWSSRTTRVRPPSPHKGWSDAARSGIDLRLWWTERLADIERSDPLAAEEEDREERAAIMEFDGGLTREAAERAAGLRVESSFTSGRGT